MYTLSILQQLISCIDLTSLEATDNEKSLQPLVHKANAGFYGVLPAAVCVYPNWGKWVSEQVKSPIKTAVVGGCFPSGQTLTRAKEAELELIEKLPVQEVDIVISRGEFLNGDYDGVLREIVQMRNAVPTKKLKVILETGELKTAENIQKSAQLAINAGADFIKTSTGKSAVGATPEAVEVMCHVIESHFKKTGNKIGIKPSGGIRTIDDAITYLEIVKRILGETWLTPDFFRIGASSLYDAILTAEHGA